MAQPLHLGRAAERYKAIDILLRPVEEYGVQGPEKVGRQAHPLRHFSVATL